MLCRVRQTTGKVPLFFYLPAAAPPPPPLAPTLVSGLSFSLEGPGRSIQYTLSSMLFNVLPTILEIGESSVHSVASAHLVRLVLPFRKS